MSFTHRDMKGYPLTMIHAFVSGTNNWDQILAVIVRTCIDPCTLRHA